MNRLRAIAQGGFISLVLLLLGEGVLRLAGVGYSHRLFIEGGDPDAPLLYPNSHFARQYYPRLTSSIPTPGRSVLFEKEKDPEIYRIFVIGESTSQGFPYVATEAFPFLIEQMLSRAGVRCEVINLSMSAITSYVGLDIAREVAALNPDLVLLYFGHNEFLGIGGSAAHTSPLFRLSQLASRTRIYQAIKQVLSPAPTNEPASLLEVMGEVAGMPHSGEKYRATLRAFEHNLESAVSVLTEAGAEVLLLGVARNTRDFPPFRSQRAKTASEMAAFSTRLEGRLTADHLDELEVDSADALESYLVGHALLRRGRPGAARVHFEDACDLDLLRFRATREVHQAIGGVCEEGDCLYFDCQAIVDSLAADGIAGNESFVDQVHPSLAVHHLLARRLTELILQNRFADIAIDTSYASIEAPSTLVDLIKAASTLNTLYETALFRQLGYRNDLGLRPVFRPAASTGGSRDQLQPWIRRGDFEHIRSVYAQLPSAYQLHISYGAWLLKRRRHREAFAEFMQAHRLNRLSVSARNNLALVYVNLGMHAEATRVLEELTGAGIDDTRLRESLYRLYRVTGRDEEARQLEDELAGDGVELDGDRKGLRLYEY